MDYLKEIFTERYWFRRNLKMFGFLRSENNYIAYRKPKTDNYIMFEAIHPFGKRPFLHLAEYNTAQIAHFAAFHSNSPILISLLPRHLVDLNKSEKAKMTKMKYPINEELQQKAIEIYHGIIMDCLKNDSFQTHLEEEKLIVSIHGMKNSPVTDIDLGTGNGKKCDHGLAVWFKDELQQNMKNYGVNLRVSIDKLFSNSWGNFVLNKKSHLGKNLKLLQIEISQEMRIKYPYEIALSLAKIADKFSKNEIEKREILAENSQKLHVNVYLVDDNADYDQPKIYMSYKQRKAIQKRVKERLVLEGWDGIEFAVHTARRDKLGLDEVGISKSFMVRKGISAGHKLSL